MDNQPNCAKPNQTDPSNFSESLRSNLRFAEKYINPTGNQLEQSFNSNPTHNLKKPGASDLLSTGII